MTYPCLYPGCRKHAVYFAMDDVPAHGHLCEEHFHDLAEDDAPGGEHTHYVLHEVPA